MMRIRPVKETDLPGIEELATRAGTGITNLPKTPALLQRKIAESVRSFGSIVEEPQGSYLLVLENSATQQLLGTSTIIAKTHGSEMGCYYRIEEEQLPDRNLPGPKTIAVLRPVFEPTFATEIAGLYLLPEQRKGGQGRLLSLSRFLLMAAFPKRFLPTVIADMRGVIEDNCYSPFWEAVGKHFIHLEFREMLERLADDDSFIPQVLTQHPIYIPLLPQTAQKVIGQTHANTRAALKMLFDEGFHQTQDVDVLAGGPRLEALLKWIRTIRVSSLQRVGDIIPQPVGPERLISNEKLDLRVCLGAIQLLDQQVILSEETAQALEVKRGDQVRIAECR